MSEEPRFDWSWYVDRAIANARMIWEQDRLQPVIDENAALKAEVERLKIGYIEYSGTVDPGKILSALHVAENQVATLTAENAQLRADAERLRDGWIRCMGSDPTDPLGFKPERWFEGESDAKSGRVYSAAEVMAWLRANRPLSQGGIDGNPMPDAADAAGGEG